MKLTPKISLTILVILAFAISVTALLNYYKYQSTLRELVQSRFFVVGLDLKNAVEGSVSLGIPLSQTENIQELLSRVKASDEQILSAEVFGIAGANGIRLFNTDPANIGEAVPASWVTAAEKHDAESWRFDEDAAFGVGLPVINNFNKPIGGIVLRYSRAYQQGKIDAMFDALGRSALVVFAIACLLAFIGVYVFFRPISSTFTRMTASLNSLVSDEAPTLTEENAVTPEEKHYAEFQSKTNKVLEVLREARREGLIEARD
jgi:sensor histidine kinase regulating citrate/malate metabolism